MSYEPLHHKYRPQTFADLVGQEAIATTLSSAIQQRKIAPAYLFTGPRGTGKTSSARILAKSLNCLSSDRPTPQPCGQCEVCRAISYGSALDVMEIDAASNTGVDNIREIIERCQFAPVQSRYKVYCIDECHMLSTAAFNALLKTLEEPPERVVFVLATTDPQRVLSTIISRCQRFDFRRIPLAAMISHLKYIATEEKINITEEAITLVAQIANGGLRDAESLLDQLSLLPEIITVEQVWDLVGSVPEQDLLALLEAIASNQPEQVIDRCRNLLDRGREPLVVLQNLAGFYLNLLIAKTAPNRPDLVAVTETTWQNLCTQAQEWDIQAVLQGQQHLKAAEVQLKNTTQPRLWLEVTLLGLISFQPNREQGTGNREQVEVALPEETLLKKRKTEIDNRQQAKVYQDNLPQETKTSAQNSVTLATEVKPSVATTQPSEPITSNRQLPSSQQSPYPPAENVTTPKGELPKVSSQEIWQKAIAHLQPPTTQALFKQKCHLISLEGSVAIVGISSPQLLKLNQGKIPNLEAAFAKACQRTIKVKLEASNISPPEIDAVPSVQPASTQTPVATPTSTSSVEPKDQSTASPEKKTLTPQPEIQHNHQPTQNKETTQKVTHKPEPVITRKDSLEDERLELEDVFFHENKQFPNESNSEFPTPNSELETVEEKLQQAVEALAENFEGEIVTLASAISLEEKEADVEDFNSDKLLESTTEHIVSKTPESKEKKIDRTISPSSLPIPSETTASDKLEPLSSQQLENNQQNFNQNPASVTAAPIIHNRPDLSEYEDDDDVPF